MPFLRGTALNLKMLSLRWSVSILRIFGELCLLVNEDLVVHTEPLAWWGETALEKGRPNWALEYSPSGGASRGHAWLTCAWLCVAVPSIMSQGCSSAQVQILKTVSLSSSEGEVDIPFFPTGLFVCAFSRWCASERSLCSGNGSQWK